MASGNQVTSEKVILSDAIVLRPVLFMDLDDVCVLNTPYGAYDVALALAECESGRALQEGISDLWHTLVAPGAAKLLQLLDAEFHPVYVLSSSWWWLMDDEMLKAALRRAGLGFVVSNLHLDMSTPKGSRPDIRWNEIRNWLNAHPEFAERWVVLDDELSGTGLLVDEADERRPFIILCAKNVGLTELEYEQLRAAFLLRLPS